MEALGTAIGGRAISLFGPGRARMEQLGAWFAEEYEPLLRFAYFVCGERATAEDLVQEAFVRLYRAGARAENAGVGAYARTTIVNLARSGARRRAVAARAPMDAAPRAGLPDIESRDEVWRAMRELSPQQRAVIALRYYEDLSEKDIAAALGVSAGTVKKQSDRAMTKLRAELGRNS